MLIGAQCSFEDERLRRNEQGSASGWPAIGYKHEKRVLRLQKRGSVQEVVISRRCVLQNVSLNGIQKDAKKGIVKR